MIKWIKNVYKKKKKPDRIVIEYLFKGRHTNISLFEASMNDRQIFAFLEVNGKKGHEALNNAGVFLTGEAKVFFNNYFKEND
jgi:hypothetical protein